MSESKIARKKILSIGRDATVLEKGSQFNQRFVTYDSFHTHKLLVLGTGDRVEKIIGNSTATLVGGKSLPGAFFAALKEALQAAKKNEYDLVTTQDVLYAGIIGYIVSKRYKLPLYVQLHGDHLDNDRWFKSKVGKFNRLMNNVGKFVLKRADQIRVVSGRLKDQIVANYKLDPERIVSIPIGTNTSMFVPSDDVQREPIIAFAQRLILEKQPMLFVEVTKRVMEQVPEVRVEIAGDGVLKEDMQAAYETAGLSERVTFLGAVAQPDLVALYQKSKCYLHTADWEGWGMPMIEAMAAGCPVVTTDTGCAGEAIVDGETGFVAAINDVDALTEATIKLMTDEQLWQNVSEKGIVAAKEWSFASLTRKNMQWYAAAGNS
jgi:glycosyltransferase involved in cell wall biosynthesis